MVRASLVCLLLLPLMVFMDGCGGLGISGGSVPIGKLRSVVGKAALPSSQPMSNATVSVRVLPTRQVVQTTTTDAGGAFVLPKVPVDSDVEIVVQTQPTTTIKGIVPRATLGANPDQPLDVGTLTALTTVVAEAIERETLVSPDETGDIVSTQTPALTQEIEGENQPENEQENEVNNASALGTEANTLIIKTADSELDLLANLKDASSASVALRGLLSLLQVVQQRPINLVAAQRTALSGAQLSGRTFTPDVVAAALRAVGTSSASAEAVQSASQIQRAQLPALSRFGPGISPYEAFLIAGSMTDAGGFQLEQAPLNAFIAQLLRP